jgi:hypothetical protein
VLALNAWDKQVQILLRFRVGTHKLRCNDHSVVVSGRTCRLCGDGVADDEYHVVLECETYRDTRDMRQYSHLYMRDDSGARHEDLKSFMNQKDALGQFNEDRHLRVNIPKCMYVVFKPMRSRAVWPTGLQCKGQELQEVQVFKYLGLPISSTR